MSSHRTSSDNGSPGEVCCHLQPILERALAHEDRVALSWWDRANRWYRVTLDRSADPAAPHLVGTLPHGIELIETPELVRLACPACRHSIDLPRAQSLPVFEEQELSPGLLAAYQLEIELGNRLDRVSREVGGGPLALTMARPLHFDAIRQLQLPSSVERWECWDPHYSIEAGLSCRRSGQVLAGPPPLIPRLQPLLETVVRTLVAGSYDDLEPLCRAGEVTPDDLRGAVEQHGERLIEPPADAYRLQTGSGADSLLIGPIPGRQPPAWLVSLTLWSEESGRGELVLVLTVEQAGEELRPTIEGLSTNPLPTIRRARQSRQHQET